MRLRLPWQRIIGRAGCSNHIHGPSLGIIPAGAGGALPSRALSFPFTTIATIEFEAAGVVLWGEHAEDTQVAKKGHTEEQILRAMRQAEGGTRVADICREHGISEATFYIYGRVPTENSER